MLHRLAAASGLGRSMSTAPRVFGAFTLYKDTGGLQVKPVPPKFKPTGASLGLAKQVRAFALSLAAPACHQALLHRNAPRLCVKGSPIAHGGVVKLQWRCCRSWCDPRGVIPKD